MITIPKDRLDGSAVFIPYKARHKAAPIQRIQEKKVVSS